MSRPAICFPLVFTVLAWGYNFIALKHLYLEMTPAAAALMRHVLMYFVLVAICGAWKYRPTTESGEEGGNWLWAGWRVGWFGVLSMGIYMILFLEALKRTSAPEGAIVIATAPLWTTLFAIVAKQEAFSWRVMAGAIIAFLGVVLVVFGGAEIHLENLAGNGLMLASAIAWALTSVWSRPLVSARPAIVVLTQSMPTAMLVLVPYSILDVWRTPWLSLTAKSYLAFGHFTILAGALGFAGFFYGVQRVGASGAMLYQYGVAPLATIFAWMFLGDRLHPVQLMGMAVVLTGVVLGTAARNRAAAADLAKVGVQS